jgi:thiosulfate reductase cytochrome b subunit
MSSMGEPMSPSSAAELSPVGRPRAPTTVARHGLVTRLTHWINAVAMTVLLMSGLQILNAHPAFYWSDAGFDPALAVFAIGDDDASGEERGWVRIGSHRFDTTGVLGVSASDGSVVVQAFPRWVTLPTWRDLATGRRWHFAFAWVLVLNGFVYLVFSARSGHLRHDLWPRLSELSPGRVMQVVYDHLLLRRAKGHAALGYNVLQKLSYVVVVLMLVPLVVLTGCAMSPGLDAAAPWLPALFGGRQAARLLHFLAVNSLVAFVVVHLLALLAVGVWNELRSMITGRFVVPEER